MNLSTFAKASLALSLLTTGVVTTNAQSTHAAQATAGVSQDTNTLKNYYNGPSFEYKNVNLHKDGNKVDFVADLQFTVVDLLGSDKERLKSIKDGDKYDVFVVREGTGRQAENRTIGGITKANNEKYKDQLTQPDIEIKRTTDELTTVQTVNDLKIYKEEISLKELDFKLRKQLIEKHELYKKDPQENKIKVIMNDGSYYTFELNKKLQDHRMGDVIESKNIKKIEVDL
ncbi:exotoxin beta-grasp domain-containing protein [Staphylococcus lutrae]|uniref:Superantigen-like protein n=1 Tax=Staphylococcus lutrae TaxID=155085 RepID=A0AAC9WJL8_9STAP|nr:hypothetical protein [Staphylococcus lutrae]ARJ50971.1 hypothetical protein B5P37_06375 [Staphylococcus lutrae]PNZ34956.1 superantigen-like protein [Staphylococcus lutrae]